MSGPSVQDVLTTIAHDARLRRFLERRTVSHDIVRRYVAGESVTAAMDVTGELLARRRLVSITHLVSDPLDQVEVKDRRKRIRKVLRRLAQAGYSQDGRVEVSVRLGALGALQGRAGRRLAVEHAAVIARSAAEAGTTLTLETERGLPVEVTFEALTRLREEHPGVGIAVQAALRRTETDCRDLAGEGHRVRLAKGTGEGGDAFATTGEIDRAYARCLRVLMDNPGIPVVATHDARLLSIATYLAYRAGREATSFEYQLRYGVRPEQQGVIADRGDRMRVYLPFGPDWYPYLMSRVAQEPGTLPALLRAATAR